MTHPDRSCRTRPREDGVVCGSLAVGLHNALTDVPGVLVGQVSLIEGDDVRTGATAILPHDGSLWHDRVPAGIAVANGFGKLMGFTQVIELGELETPIVLTNTLSVPQAAEAILEWTLGRPEAGRIRSINPVVGETNDGRLNAIERRVLRSEHVLQALHGATDAPPQEGNVGAGTGTVALGWKGGIGTSSRRLPDDARGSVVGVLVQSNFGGSLHVLGVPLGRLLPASVPCHRSLDGSMMIVLATNAPLSDRNLTRLAARTFAGAARMGASFGNGSGDYAIAFSTAPSVRRTSERRRAVTWVEDLPNEQVSALFLAAMEATEEAVLNSLAAAETMTGRDGMTIHALPWPSAVALLRERRAVG